MAAAYYVQYDYICLLYFCTVTFPVVFRNQVSRYNGVSEILVLLKGLPV